MDSLLRLEEDGDGDGGRRWENEEGRKGIRDGHIRKRTVVAEKEGGVEVELCADFIVSPVNFGRPRRCSYGAAWSTRFPHVAYMFQKFSAKNLSYKVCTAYVQ